MYKYELIAMDIKGGWIRITGDTLRAVIDKFDQDYDRTGYKIAVYREAKKVQSIKKTFK